MEECSVSDIGAESFSLLSRRCRTRQYQTEPALMAARSPNELIMERKAPTRTKEMTFFSLLNIRQWEGIDYRSVEEKFTSTLQKGLQSWVLQVKSRTMPHFANTLISNEIWSYLYKMYNSLWNPTNRTFMHFSLTLIRLIKTIRTMLCIFYYLMSLRSFNDSDNDFHTDSND